MYSYLQVLRLGNFTFICSSITRKEQESKNCTNDFIWVQTVDSVFTIFSYYKWAYWEGAGHHPHTSV